MRLIHFKIIAIFGIIILCGSLLVFNSSLSESVPKKQRSSMRMRSNTLRTAMVAHPVPPVTRSQPKILVTVATALGRRWITLLSLLSITNAVTEMKDDGMDVDLLVSFVGQPYDVAIKRTLQQTAFDFNLILEHVTVTQGGGGFVRSREHLVDYFLNSTSKYTHWIHLDDDMLVGHDRSLSRSVHEYMGNMEKCDGSGTGGTGGVLVLFLNTWSRLATPINNHGPLFDIKYAGAPAFILNRQTLQRIGGNPYASCRVQRKKGCPDGEAANEWFWNKLKQHKMSLLSNTQYPFSVQHLANSHSLIFGKQIGWEHLWATNRNIKYLQPERRGGNKNKKRRKSTRLVQVLPFVLKDVRHAVRPSAETDMLPTKAHSKLGHSNALVSYVLQMNNDTSIGRVRFPLEKVHELQEDIKM